MWETVIEKNIIKKDSVIKNGNNPAVRLWLFKRIGTGRLVVAGNRGRFKSALKQPAVCISFHYSNAKYKFELVLHRVFIEATVYGCYQSSDTVKMIHNQKCVERQTQETVTVQGMSILAQPALNTSCLF